IALEVSWGREDSVRGKVFHMGLETKDEAADVTRLLAEEGLLPKAPPEGRPMGQRLLLDFPTLSRLSATANMSDQKLLSLAGLEKLAGTHKCFPVNHQGA